MRKTDKTVALLQLLGSLGRQSGQLAAVVVEVNTAEPDDVTLVMQGTELPLGTDVFELPVDAYPLRKGDRYLALPLEGGTRWAVITKLTGGMLLGTMQSATSLQLDGVDVVYGAELLVIPPFFLVGNAAGGGGELATANSRPLAAGDRVSASPFLDGDTVKYAILQRY